MTLLYEQWWLILVAVAVVALLLFLLLRPRQRVTLTDSAPVRPHMAQSAAPAERQGIGGETALRAGDVSGAVPPSPVHQSSQHVDRAGDDFLQLKGVGPKLASALNEHGLWRFEQLAALDAVAAGQLDGQLGAFRGRLARDRIVEQARLLAAGDRAGFEAEFGKL